MLSVSTRRRVCAEVSTRSTEFRRKNCWLCVCFRHRHNKLVPFVGLILWKYCLFLSLLGVRCSVAWARRHAVALHRRQNASNKAALARCFSQVRNGANSHAGIRFGQVSCSCSITQRLSMESARSAATAANLGKCCLDYRWCSARSPICSQLRVGFETGM